MLNPLNFITKLIKSKNQKELDRITKIVSKINSLEEDIKKLKDVDFPKKTLELKKQIKNGKTLDDVMPEAYALVREASKRKRGERHFDVQAGFRDHSGRFPEAPNQNLLGLADREKRRRADQEDGRDNNEDNYQSYILHRFILPIECPSRRRCSDWPAPRAVPDRLSACRGEDRGGRSSPPRSLSEPCPCCAGSPPWFASRSAAW